MTFEGVSQYRGVPLQAPSPLHYAAALHFVHLPWAPFWPPLWSCGHVSPSVGLSRAGPPRHTHQCECHLPWGAATGAMSLAETRNCSPEHSPSSLLTAWRSPTGDVSIPCSAWAGSPMRLVTAGHLLGMSLAQGASQPGDGKLATRPWCMPPMLITVYVPISLPA